jgi:hypothetical protein
VHSSIAHMQDTLLEKGKLAWEGLASTLAMGLGAEGKDRAVLLCMVVVMSCLLLSVWSVWSVWLLQRVSTSHVLPYSRSGGFPRVSSSCSTSTVLSKFKTMPSTDTFLTLRAAHPEPAEHL